MGGDRFAISQDLGDIAKMNDWLNMLAARYGWGDPVRNDIKLCLNEAVTNIISYGFEATENPAAELVVEQSSNQIKAQLKDNGIAFDPLAQPQRSQLTSLDDTPIGGFGIQLMREHCTHIAYTRDKDFNRLDFYWDKDPS